MSKSMKQNLVQVITWSTVAIGVLLVFTRPDTIQNWGDNRTKTLLLALLFLIGFGTDFVVRLMEKSKRFGFIKDERDREIQHKSLEIGYVGIILYIFVLTITLYAIYEAAGALPIGWVWFIAYTTIVTANLIAGITSLFMYRKHGS